MTEPGNEHDEKLSMDLMAQDSPLKSAIRANSSYKVREFEWFEVETKIRLFVQRLMEPTLQKIYEDRKVVDQVQWNIKQNNEAVDMLRDVVMNQGAGIPIFEEFHRRVFEVELKVEQAHRKNQQEVDRLESQLARVSHDQKQLQEQHRQIELIKNQLIEEFAEVKRHNLEFREHMTQALQNLSAELTANFTWARQNVQRFDEKFGTVDITLQDHQNQILNEDKKITDLRQLALEFTQKHQQHITRFEKTELNVQQLFETVHLTRKLTTAVQNLQNNLSTLDSYVSTYQPLYIQGQISESLFYCLPQNQLNKLALYEMKRYDEIHKNILNDDGQGKVQQKIQEYTAFMEGITKRNSKIIQQQKVRRVTSQGTEGNERVDSKSNVTNTLQDENIRNESDSELSSSSEHHAEQQPKRSTNNGGGMTGAEVQHYEEMLAQVRQQIADETKEFKSKIELTVRDVYAQIKEVDEQIFMQNFQNQEELDKRQAAVLQQVQALREAQGDVKGNCTSIEQQVTTAIKETKQLETVVQSVLHYLVLVTHLLIQDEIDRQGIALMGVKDSNIDDLPPQQGQLPAIRKVQAGNKVMQIKPDCLSCSSQPLTTLTAFKLACLAYNPSDIQVDGKLFKRDQLLEVCTKVLWSARKEMNEIAQEPKSPPMEPRTTFQHQPQPQPLTNAHISQQQSVVLQSPSMDLPSVSSVPRNKLNTVNLNVDLIQQPPKSNRRQQLRKKLFSLNQSQNTSFDMI